MKQILGELDELPEFQMRELKGRKGLLREEHSIECAKIYSPRRVTQVVSAIGLGAALSLDLTTLDPVDGQPLDFRLEVKRKRAVELLERVKPLLFVACPMCGPLGALQNLTDAKLSTKEVKAKLRDAMAHVKFALDVCLRQYLEGRCFVFEHPTSASSCGTAMIKHVMKLEGVHTARFDFCQVGMETVNAAGEKQATKKRTTVMTNSANLKC